MAYKWGLLTTYSLGWSSKHPWFSSRRPFGLPHRSMLRMASKANFGPMQMSLRYLRNLIRQIPKKIGFSWRIHGTKGRFTYIDIVDFFGSMYTGRYWYSSPMGILWVWGLWVPKSKSDHKFKRAVLKRPLFFFWQDMGVSWNGGTPISHPKMIIFSTKPPWLLGTTILGTPYMGETCAKWKKRSDAR